MHVFPPHDLHFLKHGEKHVSLGKFLLRWKITTSRRLPSDKHEQKNDEGFREWKDNTRITPMDH